MSKTALLVDAYSQIYRAFYAIRSLTGPTGEPVNAIFGFTKMLRKQLADQTPSHVAVVFDLGPPRQRLTRLPSYKAQRPPTPPDLDAQLPVIREVLEAMRLPIVEIDGEEADDIIATLAVQSAKSGLNVLIATNDKDFMQIVGPCIRLTRPDGKEAAIVDDAAVKARYGVLPEQIVDFLSLLGDSVDNIPGVPGVGEKTAAELLGQFKSLDNLIAHLDEVRKPKLAAAIRSHAAALHRNRELVRLRTDMDLPVKLDALHLQPPDLDRLRVVFRRCGFKSLVAELDKRSTLQGSLFSDA